MRRRVATFVAAALLLSIAGPAFAGHPAPVASPTQAPAVASAATRASSTADPTGRWIVVYKNGTNVAATSARLAKAVGFTVDRTFKSAFRGLTAKLSPRQVRSVRRDPAVASVVPDEKIELAATAPQLIPTGIDRISGRLSDAASIDGVDERVDADVAVVDTGIATVADLNVAGGYNCSTTNRSLWRDVQGHGTHVAGTVGAIDNGIGVVGVAPGVRLWAVKILDDSGSGLLSWYVCGLDWIAAQRDPLDPTRPMIESVNMSVTKWGQDDRDCGNTNDDILHQAICRVVAGGITVVAAAANDHGSAAARVPAAYNEVITVSALADSDGKPGALGGPRCFSWGSYDDDDSFANFSNYGSDVDIIAPGKCIWSTVPGGYQYMSGTSMAAPHVSGAVALLKAMRPNLAPAEVKQILQDLGTLDWKITSDPDPYHEKLLNVSRIAPRGVSVIGTK
jgi:subtilisin